MTGRFLPIAKAIPCAGGYRGTVKLFENVKEKCIPGGQVFVEASDARRAAREYLATILNAEIKGVQIAPNQRELSEVEKWREERRRQTEAERQKVFGDPIPKNKSGRIVEVVKVAR